MDPYLEQPGLWPEVHTRLIVAIADVLGPMVRPRYRVAVEQRSYLAMAASDETVIVPDVLVADREPRPHPAPPVSLQSEPSAVSGVLIAELPMPEARIERYIEIRSADTHEVVTSIELLSPTNKMPGEGRRIYETKRLQVLSSMTHLIEIDLLRAGASMPMGNLEVPRFDYSIVVSRAHQRPKAEIRLFRLRQPIPSFPVPLRAAEVEPVLELNTIVHDLYDRAGYDIVIDDQAQPTPPLRQDDAAWAQTRLRAS